jgi:7-cyano-7-deazaguanine synthase in queuosine biosynthesis
MILCFYSLKAYEAEDKLRYLIESSVKQRLVSSDTEVGIFLSGGLDSSIITKYATKYSENIKSFSINFKQSEISEKKYFNHIGNLFKTKQIVFLRFYNSVNAHKLFGSESGEIPLTYYLLKNVGTQHDTTIYDNATNTNETFNIYENKLKYK